MSPRDFIPIAEETGLILPLGDWVLETACRQLSGWNAAGFPDFYVSVNLSVKQFNQPDLVERLTDIIKASGARPENLRIEITESSLLRDVEVTVNTLRRLKDLGVRLAIDDFGTGYSSLNYLRRFPVDTISSDIYQRNIEGPVYDMPTTMSKLLYLGMPFDEVLLRSTLRPAQVTSRSGSRSPDRGPACLCGVPSTDRGLPR